MFLLYTRQKHAKVKAKDILIFFYFIFSKLYIVSGVYGSAGGVCVCERETVSLISKKKNKG